MTHINFSILNSHVIVTYLKLVESTYLYATNRKTGNSCIGSFQEKKRTATIKWHLLENLTFQNLLQNRKLLPAEKLGNVLAFDKESKRRLCETVDKEFCTARMDTDRNCSTYVIIQC